jgi:hypothetical protein
MENTDDAKNVVKLICKNDGCDRVVRVVIAKGICQACRSKSYRNTPKGKLYTKLYNDGKGRENSKRYLAKKNLLKPVKIPNHPKESKPCECGEKSIAKGYCRNCYQKHYQRKKNENKPRKYKPRREYIRQPRKKTILENIKSVGFNDVLLLLQYGFTIKKSCEKLDLTYSDFYNKISKEQKSELIEKQKFYSKKIKSLTAYEKEITDIGYEYDLRSMVLKSKDAIKKMERLINKKIVLQYTLDNVFICKYNSLTEASQNVGIDIAHISRVCNGKANPTRFIFKYETLDIPKEPLDELLYFL